MNDPSEREWLVTNGLGGYASGTIAGVPTRRYHGLLIAALPNPLGRMLMLNQLADEIVLPSGATRGLCWSAAHRPEERLTLEVFRLEVGLPVWRYAGHGVVIERRVIMVHDQNTVLVRYRLLSGDAATLRLRPTLSFRGHDALVSAEPIPDYPLYVADNRVEVIAPDGIPKLHLLAAGDAATFEVARTTTPDVMYPIEESRGYASRGRLQSPGYFTVELHADRDVTAIASTEPWETNLALDFVAAHKAETDRRYHLVGLAWPNVQDGVGAELVLAADQFVIRPVGRAADDVRARAAGDRAVSVIAGYHWFTDWGRDTMISLEGLTLVTGRVAEAGAILRMFAAHLRDGLVPNMFPEGESEGLYHTADATLWFVHALDRYLAASHDDETLTQLMPRLYELVDRHLTGTRFGIGVDPADGLLRQGAEGYQLTWMDAKAGDWVVTPRRGKAVEINALWYNALRLIEAWARVHHDDPRATMLAHHADRARDAFNQRFWNETTRHLFDVVDGEHGDDPACRPNQVFAMSLRHPVLDRSRWVSVMQVVKDRLLTPVGLRSLDPGHPDFKPTYRGDLLTRDAAYHQGTVWSWLIGPYVDAALRVWPERRDEIRASLDGLLHHLDGEACIGSISEVFDAEPPFRAGGCIAQAWGVAELLRSLAAF